jgi:hypothetical protein
LKYKFIDDVLPIVQEIDAVANHNPMVKCNNRIPPLSEEIRRRKWSQLIGNIIWTIGHWGDADWFDG